MEDLDRRVRLVRVPQQQVLDWFTNAVEGWPETVNLPVSMGLPKGAKVGSVHHDFMSRCFIFTVFHESFDAVPEGEMIPYHNNPLWMEWKTIINPEVKPPDPRIKLSPAALKFFIQQQNDEEPTIING